MVATNTWVYDGSQNRTADLRSVDHRQSPGKRNAGGDAAAGKAKSALCASCHGPVGKSSNDLWPNLAGQKEAYLVSSIKAYQSGTRTDPMMAPMVQALSETDIADIAAFFSSQEP